MTRQELINRISEKNPHLSNSDVDRVVSTVFEEITQALSDGNRVELRGFGAFSVKERAGYQGRNPRTGESVEVKPKYVPAFKVGKHLREELARMAGGARK